LENCPNIEHTRWVDITKCDREEGGGWYEIQQVLIDAQYQQGVLTYPEYANVELKDGTLIPLLMV
jgi:hypothetical protein